MTIGLCSQFEYEDWTRDVAIIWNIASISKRFLRYWPLCVLGSRPFDLSGSLNVTVTWPFDSQVAISYRCSIVTKFLSRAVSEIMGAKHIRVTTLTFLGHVTSSVTWPFDSQVAISYRCSTVTKSLSPAVSEILASKCILVTTLTFQGHVTSRSRDHWTRDGSFPIGGPLDPTQVSISNGFRDIPPQTSWAHWHNAKSSLRMREITWCVPLRKI